MCIFLSLVFTSAVLDLSLLDWLQSSQVTWPSFFDELKGNDSFRGLDLSTSFPPPPLIPSSPSLFLVTLLTNFGGLDLCWVNSDVRHEDRPREGDEVPK